MRITSIELAGSADDGMALPRAYARISRKDGSEYIDVTIMLPAGERTHHVKANDEDDQWSMAECLLDQLEGRTGPNSDINDYFRIIQRFAD